MNIVIRILANSGAIYLASRLVPGFVFSGNILDLFIAGTILGLINALVRPVLKFISFPIIFLTLGLFSVVINIFLLYLADSILTAIHIQNFIAAIWVLIIISLVNNLFSYFINKEEN